MRDCYCMVNLDQEEVFWIKIVEKLFCFFYGEDFYCEIFWSFCYLFFYIFDRDVFWRDFIIGKVVIQKEDLQKYYNRDIWFQLQYVDVDLEVQGKVYLELWLSEVIIDIGVVCYKFVICIVECQGFFIVNGQCDFYVIVILVGFFRLEVKKIKVKWKINNFQFDEVFYFEVIWFCSYSKKFYFDFEEEDVDKFEIRVDFWNVSNLKFGDEFLGELRILLKVLWQFSFYEVWYFLQFWDNGSKSLKLDDLGFLWLNVVYMEDYVFFFDYYSFFWDLLLKFVDVEFVLVFVVYILGEVCWEKQEVVVLLVWFLLYYGRVVFFISVIVSVEVKWIQDFNIIF